MKFKVEENPKNFISWGGGLQSTVLGVMSALGDLPRADGIVFSDLGFEHSYTYEIVNFYKKYYEDHGLNVHIVNPVNIGETENNPLTTMPYFCKGPEGIGMLNRQCTQEYKIFPIRMEIRRILGLRLDGKGRTKKGLINQWLGITTDESKRAKPSRTAWINLVYPFLDMGFSRGDCITYLEKRNLPVPKKSACIGCPYQSNKTILDLKNNYVDDYNKLVLFDKKIRHPKAGKYSTGEFTLYLRSNGMSIEEVVEAKKYEELVAEDECNSGYCFL